MYYAVRIVTVIMEHFEGRSKGRPAGLVGKIQIGRDERTSAIGLPVMPAWAMLGLIVGTGGVCRGVSRPFRHPIE